MASGDVLIRDPEPDDEAAWRRLWSGYLTFYKVDLPEDVTAETWKRILDADVPMFARLAVSGRSVSGFSISTLHPSTWTSGLNCYLEDLFVDPDIRGRGIGRALIDDLLSMAKQKGWSRLYWHTNAANETARRLYDRYVEADDFVRYRLVLS